jgi:hypothetical protein
MAQWQNDDGLTVRFGQDQARETGKVPAVTMNSGPARYLVMDVNGGDEPDYTTDLNNDGTKNGFSDQDNFIPAGSFITRAIWINEVLFAGGTDYDIGLFEKDGTVINVDGIEEALLVTVIDGTNDTVLLNGSEVGGILSTTLDSYVKFTPNGTFTAGKAKLIIEYFQVDV